MHIYLIIMIIVCFIWAGFMGAISFMESWLKFRAQGVELTAGLSIGRLIFKVLNRVEWVFLIILWGGYILAKPAILPMQALSYFLLSMILLVQTIWLLPVMDRRALATIEGKETSRSLLHIWFAGLEVIKFLMLIDAGINLLYLIK
ncbi:MAG TPA: hypothetical protein VFX43_07680 [Chitinophagaceae bacterium]|nr:hypothetical protein [Chitinophagaceae bacterium]